MEKEEAAFRFLLAVSVFLILLGINNTVPGYAQGKSVGAGAAVANKPDNSNPHKPHNSLIRLTSEPVGANCANAGTKVESGLDLNDNDVLEDGEVTATAYACNGHNGFNSLVSLTPEPAGAKCINGGVNVESGLDKDKNGFLSPTEIDSIAYICNGTNGKDGHNSLASLTPEPTGAKCINGGTRVESGLDDNRNLVLDPDEVDALAYICNGIDGTDGINGKDGKDGADGVNSLVSLNAEPVGAKCSYGGTRIDSGLDDNRNGILNTSEIDYTAYICCCLLNAPSPTPPPTPLPGKPWIKQLGTPFNDRANGVAVDVSGNTYLVGYTYGAFDGYINTGLKDIFLIKYGNDGTKSWHRMLGTTYDDEARDVAVDTAGNIYITGHTNWGMLDGIYNNGVLDFFLIKYRPDGTKVWSRLVGTKGNETGHGVAVDSDGNIYVTGFTEGGLFGSNAGTTDIYLAKFDPNGTKLWIRQSGSKYYPGDNDEPQDVAVDSTGNVYVTGWTNGSLDGNGNKGGTDVFLIKYDKGGTKQWTNQIGTPLADQGRGVAVDSSGNVYVAGWTEGSLDGNKSAEGRDIFLTKYDTNGKWLWTRQTGSFYADEAFGVAVDTSGNAYLTGMTSGGLDGNINAGNYDIFLVKYDTNGTKLYSRQLGTSTFDQARGIAVDTFGNAYVTGWTSGRLAGNANAGGEDIFLIKYVPDDAGILQVTP